MAGLLSGRPDIYREMAEDDLSHWWYLAKYRLVIERIRPRPGIKLADLGCGTGGFLLKLKEAGVDGVGVEKSPQAVAQAQTRGLTVSEGSVESPPLKEGFFDVVTLLDVLEHLPDDAAGLLSARRLLTPNGKLIVTVPAHPWLFGEHDRRVGHFRRYTKDRLLEVLRSTGFSVEEVRYVFLIPLLAAVILRPFGYKGRGLRGNPRWLQPFLAWDSRLSRGLGLTLLAVARHI